MERRETGTLPGSSRYFFSPSEIVESLFFYPVWCGHYYCTYGYSIERDTYPQMLVAYVHAGIFHVEYRGKRTEVKAGEVVLLDCNEKHHYWSEDGLEFSYLHFNGQNSQALVRYLTEDHFIFRGRQAEQAAHRLSALIDLYQFDQPLRDSKCSAMIYNILMELEEPDYYHGDANSPIQLALDFIRKNFRRKLTLEEISRTVNLSPFHFSRLFKQHTSYSPLEYVLKMRIDTAKHLLKTTDTPIESIAFQVGYSSASSFANMFTEKVGLSPSQFRKFPI